GVWAAAPPPPPRPTPTPPPRPGALPGPAPARSAGPAAVICRRIPSAPADTSTVPRQSPLSTPSPAPRPSCSFVPPISMPRYTVRLRGREREAASGRLTAYQLHFILEDRRRGRKAGVL